MICNVEKSMVIHGVLFRTFNSKEHLRRLTETWDCNIPGNIWWYSFKGVFQQNIQPLHLYTLVGVVEGPEPISAASRQQAEYNLDKSPAHVGQTRVHIHNLELPIHLSTNVFWWQEEAKAPAKAPPSLSLDNPRHANMKNFSSARSHCQRNIFSWNMSQFGE